MTHFYCTFNSNKFQLEVVTPSWNSDKNSWLNFMALQHIGSINIKTTPLK